MIDVKEHEEWEVECIGEFKDEYVYDIEMGDDTNHTFFANDILIHNSIYATFDVLMDKLKVPDNDQERLKVTRFLAKVAMNKLKEFNKTFFTRKFNADNIINFEQELIARTAIWCQPKKYVCHILEEKGKPPKDDMLKKGLDIVRSSIPRKFKEYITTAVDMILKDGTQPQLHDYILKTHKEFKTWSLDDIAIPVSCNNLSKWNNISGLNFLSGTPQHMKSVVAFNHYLDKFKLSQYEHIKESDKFKMLFIAKNNRYKIESIGYNNKLPMEFGIDNLIDWEAHFDRGFIKPLSQIFDAISWRFPETTQISADVNDLFE
jgi:hypothetical protein